MGYYKSGIVGAHKPLRRLIRTGESFRVGIAMGTGRPLLKQGAVGKYVMELQTKLGIEVDSLFGPKTTAAVKTFQKTHGLEPDGIVGPLTWAALSEIKTPPALVPVTLPDPKPTIQKGATGAAVIEAQYRLGIPVDGIFGPQTEAAVLKLQKENGLVPDGVIGPLTWIVMEGKTTPPPPSPGGDAMIKSPPPPVVVVNKPIEQPTTKPPETVVDTPNGPAIVVSKPENKTGSKNGTVVAMGLGLAGVLGAVAVFGKKKRRA